MAAPLWTVVLAAAATGVGIEVFSVLWASALQQHIPATRLARVSAYDLLGSIAFSPVGLALAGPVASAVGGVHHAMWVVVATVGVPTLLILAVPDVWRLRRASDAA
jgi:MFS family permease